ncbi:MAG: hypothetical protein RLZZ50_1554, partial [Verrucomicrobiota bacterium]
KKASYVRSRMTGEKSVGAHTPFFDIQDGNQGDR